MVSYNIQKCQNCKGELVTDNVTGEICCNKCGLVVLKTSISLEPEHYSIQGEPSKSRTGGKISNKYHDNGLATIIGTSKKDAMGNRISNNVQKQMEQLRKWDSKSKITKSRDLSLRNALFFLNDIEDRLLLPVHIVEEASSIYRQLLERKLVWGRTIVGMMSACIYAACRINSMPLSIKEIAKISNIRQRDIAMSYRVICKELEIQSEVIDPVKNIPKIAKNLHLDQNIISVASNIIKIAQKTGITSGKNPIGLAAASIYLACILDDKYITQKKVAIAADITEVTVRTRYKELKKIIEDFKKSKKVIS